MPAEISGAAAHCRRAVGMASSEAAVLHVCRGLLVVAGHIVPAAAHECEYNACSPHRRVSVSASTWYALLISAASE